MWKIVALSAAALLVAVGSPIGGATAQTPQPPAPTTQPRAATPAPTAAKPAKIASPRMRKTRHASRHHKRRYTRKGLVRLVREAGLRVDYASSFVFTCFPLMLAARLLDRGAASDPKRDFDRRVRFSPLVNRTLDSLMRVDEALVRRRVSLPWGGTLLVAARKP